MPAKKKYLYDKPILILSSLLVFAALAILITIVLRIGAGQGISDYYIEYRQGLGHSARGDFSPTGDVWAILNFIWFAIIAAVTTLAISIKIYHVKRQISIIVLSFGILLLSIAWIVSNVLLSHR